GWQRAADAPNEIAVVLKPFAVHAGRQLPFPDPHRPACWTNGGRVRAEELGAAREHAAARERERHQQGARHGGGTPWSMPGLSHEMASPTRGRTSRKSARIRESARSDPIRAL